MAKANLLHPSDRFPALTVALPGVRTGHSAKGLL